MKERNKERKKERKKKRKKEKRKQSLFTDVIKNNVDVWLWLWNPGPKLENKM